MSRKILLPLDGSQHSHRALAWYARHFNSPDDELIFAYVAEPSSSSIGADVHSSSDKVPAETIAKAKALALDATRMCSELGVRARIRFLERVEHSIGQALVELADEESVDIIVIGNRGLGGVKRTFLGSVSDYVLHHSHRATVIVPPRKDGH